LLKPHYNVLSEGYSSINYKHSKKIKDFLSFKAKNRKHSIETKRKISNSLKGERNPFFMKKHSLKSKELISNYKSRGFIYLYDSLLNLQIIFPSITILAKLILSTTTTLNTYLKTNKLFRGN
jgi:group I intron endonuclease